MEKIISYKGFDKDFKCRGMQYKVGETYTMEGDIEACSRGFHACEKPSDVFQYYAPSGGRFAIVEQSGTLARHKEDSKVASSVLTVVRELSLQEFIAEILKSSIMPEGSYSTGNYGAASSTGCCGAVSSTGDYGAASSTGCYGAASSTGDYGAASSTGYYGAASSTGNYGAASSTGCYGAASSTGNYGAASSTGDYGAASSTGYYGAASSTGYRGKVMGALGNALFLTERNDQYEILAVWAGIVGKDNILPNVWYTLKDGKPVEVV